VTSQSPVLWPSLETETVDRENPWPGLAAFRERDHHFFHGRETESEALHRLVMRERLTVLFGLSGLGKTSLLSAGLSPRLRPDNVLPVYIRLDYSDSAPALRTQVERAIVTAAEAAQVEAPARREGETLWEYFHRLDADFWSARNRPVTPLLVFDQFEEIFTLAQQDAGPEKHASTFLDELSDLVEGRPAEEVKRRIDCVPEEARLFSFNLHRYKILISLREDFLPDLEELRRRMPTIVHNRMRLRRMPGDSALRVVMRAGEHLIDPVVAAAVIRFVAGGDDGRHLPELEVEPALLSLVCRELNNKRRQRGEARITAALLEGNRTEILTDFYERCVSDMPTPVRAFVEDRLLTVSGYRDSMALENALSISGVEKAAVEQLVARRLLRLEHWGGVPRVELTHDVLTGVIRASRDTRKERQAHRSLVNADIREALGLLEKDHERPAALAHLAHALRLEPDSLVASGLIQDVLGRRSWPLLVAAIPEGGYLAAFSPDGRRLVTAAEGGRSQVWDPETGARVSEPTPHVADITSVQFSPDGRHVVTTSPDIVRVWVAESGQTLSEISWEEGGITSARFDPEGQRVLTVFVDSTAGIWDAATGQALAPPMRLPKSSTSAQFSPEGRRLVVASLDGMVQLWDLASGKPAGPSLNHEGRWVVSTHFSADGRRLATSAEDNVVRVWEVAAGRLLCEPILHESEVESLDFSPDGRQLVTAGEDGIARIWEVGTGTAVGEPMRHDGRVRSVRYDRSGHRIVTASEDGGARLWGAATGRPVAEPMHHGAPVHWAQFRVDGLQVLTTAQDGRVRIWDVRSGATVPLTLRHQGAVRAAEFSLDGDYVVTASDDRSARVWDARTGRARCEPLQHERAVLAARFSPSGKRVVTASEDRTARVWSLWGAPVPAEPTTRDPGTRHIAGTPELLGAPVADEPLRHDSVVRTAEFSPDGRHVVTGSDDGRAQVWDVESAQLAGAPLLHSDKVGAAHFSADGGYVVTASDDGTARAWDAETGRPRGEPIRMEGRVRAATLSPDGARLLIAAHDGTARLARTDDGQWIGVPMKHPLSVLSAEFSPDGQRVVTSSRDGTARLWHGETGEPIGDPMRHRGPVAVARFSPDGRRVVTASRDRTARLWDAESGRPLGEPMVHDKDVLSAQFSPDGQRLVTACFDGTAKIWDVPVVPTADAEELTSLAEALGGARVDEQGALVAVDDVVARLERLRERSDRSVFLAWFLADRFERTVGPLSRLTIKEYIEQRFAEAGEAAREEIRRHCPDHPAAAPVLVGDRKPSAFREFAVFGSAALRAPFALNVVAVSPRGDLLVWGGMDGAIRLWDLETSSLRQKLASEIQLAAGHEALVTGLVFSPAGDCIVSGHTSGALHLWRVESLSEVAIDLPQEFPREYLMGWGHIGDIMAIAVSPDGRVLASGDKESVLKLWDLEALKTGRVPNRQAVRRRQRFNFQRDDGTRAPAGVTALTFARARNWVVTGHSDRSVRVQEIADGKVVKTNDVMRRCDYPPRALVVSPDDTLLLVGGQDRALRVFDFARLVQTAILDGHQKPVTSVAVFPDGERAVSVARENRVILWNLKTAQVITTLWGGADDVFVSVAVYDEGRRIACGLSDTRIRVWAEE
jgi:WD40 repeat protein